jgi:HK97 gp10 family phage protein
MIDVKLDQAELEKLVKKLGELEKKARNKIVRKITKSVLTDLKSDAEAKAPYAGSMYKGRAGRTIRGSFEIKVRTKRGSVYGQLKNTAPHAHLQEMGWFWRKEKGGKIFHTIGTPYSKGPRPFMRPMIDEKGERALQLIAEGLKEALGEIK